MKIAIHARKGSFSDRWIAYCETQGIPYKTVNAYDTDIIEQVSDCTAFMWNHFQDNYKDLLFAKQLLFALQSKGIKVFPDFNTAWHYDDKVGQKYLLEALSIPFVPTYVFYSKQESLIWCKTTTFPKVFKLRGGAGSANVRIVKNKYQAKKIINKAFNLGFPKLNRIGFFKEKYRLFKLGKDKLGIIKGIFMYIFAHKYTKFYNHEKGYVYFQDYIPNNSFDIRVVIVDNKAFALKRMVRKNDFRASGSGEIIYAKSEIDERCIIDAFKINKKLNAQSIAFDFIFDVENKPLLVEISYTYSVKAYDLCEGYWDVTMQWHPGPFNFCGWMVERMK